jgi:predicted nucleotidyltransferase
VCRRKLRNRRYRGMSSEELTSEVVIEILKKNKEVLKKYGVKKIGLFGSFVRREQKGDSDLDFLVEFELNMFGENFKGLYRAFVDLANYLESLFSRKVELITNHSISPYIKPYIEKEIKWYETGLAVP